MAGIATILRGRATAVLRAARGLPARQWPQDRTTVGGKLLAGVIQPGGVPPPRGTREVLESYSTTPWLRAVVARISFDTAAVDWLLFAKRRPDRNEGRAVLDGQVRRIQRARNPVVRRKLIKAALEAEDLQPIENHQLLDLLNNFNPLHVGPVGRRITQQHLDLVGDAFWLIERDARGMPIALWPVPPSWILGTPTIAVPLFRVSFRGWQGAIPASEFVWFSDPDPANPYGRGSGTGWALGDEVETDEYAAKHAKAFFFNRARPDLVVSPKSDDGEGITEPEVRRLEEGWAQKAAGFWRAFKPFFIRRAVDIKELDQNLRAQQFVQLREYERNTIIQVYGVSPEMMGIVAGGANRATITMAEYIYGKRVLVPRLETQRSVIQERLVPQFDERLITDYVSPVGHDEELALDAAKIAPWALSLDEWRARMGEPQLPGDAGKVHLVPPTLDRVRFDVIDLPLGGDLPPALPEVEAAWDRYRE